MTWRFALAAAGALAGALAAPSSAFAQAAERVAAVVNDEVISSFDIRQRAALILISSGIEPTAEAIEEVRPQALRGLIDERLQLQEARQFKVDVSDREIEATLADIARSNNATVAQLGAELGRAGVGLDTLRRQIRADISWRRLVGGRFGSRVRISDVQVSETLARISTNATKPQYLVSEILVPAESEAEFVQAEQTAQRLLEQLRQGAPFPMVARQFSNAPSSAAGGDLGWLAQGELRAEIQSAVDRLQPGEVSIPFRGPGGVYLVALREKREGVAVGPPQVTYALRQVSAPAASRAALERATARLEGGCNALEGAVSSVTGARVVDMGEMRDVDLSDDARQRIASVARGAASPASAGPNETVNVLVVCDRVEAGAAGLPSRDDIENRLYEQELAMLSQRYLRNLRREATIITRNQ
jgi:peptidyl-prolyl cis-trans isomerase SurA